jgi:predicted aldo/keto reductase-like oxidoreductase
LLSSTAIRMMTCVIHWSAAWQVLSDARRSDTGAVTLRTMTSGVFQADARTLAPKWQNLYEVSLKFVLSDSLVHAAIIGMRGRKEIDRDVTLLDGFRPPFDVAQPPRMTAEIYQAEENT